MTEDPIRDAWFDLDASLTMVDSARHALASMIEEMRQEMPDRAFEHVGYCILYTLDTAAEQGRAGFDIVWEATKKKAA